MEQFAKINVRYSANYNGATLMVDEEGKSIDLEYFHPNLEVRKVAGECVGDIVEKLVDYCNDDGEFYGSEEQAEEIITEKVKNHFGKNVAVTVEFDYISS